jgi:hypothetical protein
VGGLGLVGGRERTVCRADQLPGRRLGHQRDDRTALAFRETWLAPGTGAVAQPLYPIRIEAGDPLAHRLGMAAHLSRNRWRAPPGPTADDHAGALDPVRRGVATGRQFANLARFGRVAGRSGLE